MLPKRHPGDDGRGPTWAFRREPDLVLDNGTLVASVLSVVTTVVAGALLQLVFVRRLESAAHGAVGVPLPVFGVILAVLGIESWLLWLFGPAGVR